VNLGGEGSGERSLLETGRLSVGGRGRRVENGPATACVIKEDAGEVRQQSVTMAVQKFVGGTLVGQARV